MEYKRPQGRQNQQNQPYKPYIHRSRGRGHRNYFSYDRGSGNYRQGSYDRNRRGYSSFRSQSRGYNNLRWSYRRPDNYTYKSDRRQPRFRSPSRCPTKRPRVASRSPHRWCWKMLKLKFGHFAKKCPEMDTSVDKVQHRKEISKSMKVGLLCIVVNKMKKKKKWWQQRVTGWNLQCHTMKYRRWGILWAVKLLKGWTVTKSCPLDSMSQHVNISCKKGLTAKQAECVYSKYRKKK